MEDNNTDPSSTIKDNDTENQTNTGLNNDLKPQFSEPPTDNNYKSQALNPELTTEATKKKRIKIPKITLNRNTILAGSLALLLIIVGVITLIMTKDNKTETANEESIVMQDEAAKLGMAITLKEGTLQIKSTETGEWEDATVDTEISEGSEIRTVGATSRAVIAFDDGSALRLDANSETEFETVTVERIVIKHVSGYTYNRVLPSETLKYVVNSSDAQYEALGTAFKTASTGDEQSVEVYDSSVVETSTNKTPKSGEKLTVINKTDPSKNGEVEKLDIEAVKNDPFIQWNKELDELDENFKKNLGFLSDFIPPALTINKSDGEVVLLEPDAKEGTIEISGKTESGAKLTVLSKSQPGAATLDVTVGGDGTFTTPVLTAPVGDAIFEFTAKDRAGNATTKTLRITFQRKSQPVAGNAVSFVLIGDKKGDKVELSWKFNGLNAPDGVKIVYGQETNPVFGAVKTKSIYADKGSSTSFKIEELKDGKNYIRACVYDKNSGTCGQYSNQIIIELP
jgi:hypothetical protein